MYYTKWALLRCTIVCDTITTWDTISLGLYLGDNYSYEGTNSHSSWKRSRVVLLKGQQYWKFVYSVGNREEGAGKVRVQRDLGHKLQSGAGGFSTKGIVNDIKRK